MASIQFHGVYGINAVEPILPEIGISGITPFARKQTQFGAESLEHSPRSLTSAKSTWEDRMLTLQRGSVEVRERSRFPTSRTHALLDADSTLGRFQYSILMS